MLCCAYVHQPPEQVANFATHTCVFINRHFSLVSIERFLKGDFMKYLMSKATLLITLFSGFAFCQINPSIRTIVNTPTVPVRGLVVIAPAKKYLMEERLFVGLATKLAQSGMIVVRFNWADSTLANPATELSLAARDIAHVLKSAQARFKVGPNKTVLVSKSFSTKALGLSFHLANHHILLTPNCSTEAPFAKIYGNILQAPGKTVSLFISNEDPYCDVGQIYDVMKSLSRRPALFTTHGDHNFVLPTRNPNYLFQDQIINLVTTDAVIHL
jgi:hypothetical protein